ncbi:MAG: OmpH family outer membrane protein [Chloroflexota bacterium]
MFKKMLWALVLTAAIALPSANASAQAAKGAAPTVAVRIGIVDVETIVKELPEAADADKKLKDMGKIWQDSLIAMRQDFDQKVQQYSKQKGMMPQEKQQKEEETLQAQQMQLMQYQEEKFGQTGQLNMMREQFLEPIRNKVRSAIAETAKEEKITLVLDKGGSTVLYFDEKQDITYRVLDRIKRGGK